MHLRLIVKGAAIWLVATIALRVAGQHLLHPRNWIRTVALFVVTALLMAALVRWMCLKSKLPREQWPTGAISVLLSTLLLDPFSTAFFPVVFPNIDPNAAGLFGGWILMCCTGALVGVTVRR
jgi:hypothetical protein